MRSNPPLAALTAEQLRQRALECWLMADTVARTPAARDALIRLTDEFEALAIEREGAVFFEPN
jgi:hypothetical protein